MWASPRQMRALAPQIDAWWREQVARLPELDRHAAARLLAQATVRFEDSMRIHTLATLSMISPLLEALTKLVERAEVGSVGALSGTGGAEMTIVMDIWRTSRGELAIAQLIRRRGFHGPLEGEISSRVWPENPAPLERMIREYGEKDESESPLVRERQARERLPERQREVLAALPAPSRPAARGLLRLAARTLPLRGVGKRSFLQSLDVARGAARRLGELLVADGMLGQPDDVFYLTFADLTGSPPGDAKELVARRRSCSCPAVW
jgi:pyruvate,water dikinase